MDTEIKFRIATAEKQRFKAVARKRGSTLSEWMRCWLLLGAHSDEQAGPKPIPTYPPGKPVPNIDVASGTDPQEVQNKAVTLPSGDTVLLKPLTRAEREAKIDAAQRKMAQAQKGKK